MKEDFLQFIWKMQLFQPAQLRTVFGKTVKILKPGLENLNEGPDFLNASVEVEGQLWVGHVEIHIKSSDWYVHLHQLDSNYHATILHVVWEYDVPVYSPAKVELPTVELKQYVSSSILKQYQLLFDKHQKWIYCEQMLDGIDAFKFLKWFEALYFERLQQKVLELRKLQRESRSNWEEILFWSLAKNFGLKVNGENFFDIVRNISFDLFRKVQDSNLKLEALLYGEAGLLNEEVLFPDDYYKELQEAYKFMQVKYDLKPPLKKGVHFFRLRPSNFPTIRLSQLAQVYFKNQGLFRKLIEANSLLQLYEIFDVKASEYWDSHYKFHSESTRKSKKRLSSSFIDLLIINTILPMKFLYEIQSNLSENSVVMDIAQCMQPEKNSIIFKYGQLGLRATNAMESQALIQLKNNYCKKGRCLNCVIGKEILKS